ncbi:MAG: AraC family transcriptional regulator [Lachnospiraceae bacterium]|nr:AraC family transcriptional regulator [Lachnospiraceae bacterium]
MYSKDYPYIAENIAEISRLPVRIYHSGELTHFFYQLDFPTDPATPWIQDMLSATHKVSYYITPYDQYFGIIHQDDVTFIIGPTYYMSPSRNQIRDYMAEIGIHQHYLDEYERLLQSITPMPLNLFFHLLCLINFYLCGEKLALSEVWLYDSSRKISKQELCENAPVQLEPLEISNDWQEPQHDSMGFENKMLSLVSAGDVEGLNDLFSTSTIKHPGKIANNYLRQLKNIFITAVVLVSRAAIKGGLPSEEALSLSDQYIQHAENHVNASQIEHLQHNMVLDYASRVAELQQGQHYDQFMRSVSAYIREHLHDSISVDQIAQELHTNRTSLSVKFKQDTGMTLTEYINQQKIKKRRNIFEKPT